VDILVIGTVCVVPKVNNVHVQEVAQVMSIRTNKQSAKILPMKVAGKNYKHVKIEMILL
jgi:hypothetical protein